MSNKWKNVAVDFLSQILANFSPTWAKSHIFKNQFIFKLNLVHIWRGHHGDMEQRRAELDNELEEIRLDDDLANQEAEATITLKVNELRKR